MCWIPAFISFPGGSEWILIFLVILIIFGPKSLPKVGNAIGRGIREFKDASEGITKAIEEETSAAERKGKYLSSDSSSEDEDEYETSEYLDDSPDATEEESAATEATEEVAVDSQTPEEVVVADSTDDDPDKYRE